MTLQRILCVVIIVGIILMDVWQHAHIVTLGYEIEQAQRKLKELRQSHQQRVVEVEMLSALDRIERIATTKLGMGRPRAGQVILVREASPPEPLPDKKPGLQLVKRSS